MREINYLIVHKDHPFDPDGVNSGAENATRSLARALAALGRKVVVAAQLTAAEGIRHGVEWWDLGPSFDTARALARMGERGEYYLISAGRSQVILESRREDRCLARVLISHDRSGNDTGISPKVLCHTVDKVVCVSDAQREVFLRAGADPAKVVTLYNGVDLEVFAAGQAAARNWQKLVFVGALVEDKGIHWLIESYCALKQKYPALTLDVYGTSGLWGRPALFDEKDIERRVPGIRFHGKVSQEVVAEALRTAGLCVIPSIWFDPFPLTALEAQATGCPVLTFDMGGLKEGVRDQETAVVVKEVTPQALTQALDALVSDPQKLRRFSERALEVCRPRFTWEKVAQGVESLMQSGAGAKKAALRRGKIGVVSTWNQACGLATYARYLFSEFEKGSYVVFSEIAASDRPDEDFVRRCWNRNEESLQALESAILAEDVAALHLNVHAEFFPGTSLAEMVARLKAKGLKVIAHIHNSFSLQDPLGALARTVDRVIVHNDENRLQLVANGVSASRIDVIQHGVHVLPDLTARERSALQQKLNIPPGRVIVSAFGFVQPHKGMEGVIEGVAHLLRKGLDVGGYIVGQVMPSDPHSSAYAAQLKALAQERGVADRIVFLDRFVTEDEVTNYLRASDIVLMNYRSGHFEASGACAVAVGAGAIVVTSLAPPFWSFGDAVWHLTTGFPLTLSLELLVTNAALRQQLIERARSYRERNSWKRISEQVFNVYATVGVEPGAQVTQRMDRPQERGIMTTTYQATSGLKVLIQNRPNALTQAGGDTVVMDRTVQGLRARGVQVTVDLEGRESPSNYDVVHLFNFAIPDLLRQQAERCVASGVPFVVTTLCEDVPSFHNKSWEAAKLLTEYVNQGQPREWLKREWHRLAAAAASPRFMNDYVAERASALLPNGAGEAAVLKRDYPRARSIVEVPVGFETGAAGNPELFAQQFGVRDFILCVGRIESRKNQLMLLKALEDSEIPVVLAGGGFTYQPDYERAVRAFKRRGQTILAGRLTPELLSSAYAACRVHALPSWYELPGLVSLEAAAFGKNVVVGEVGSTPDYFGERAFYADPSNWRSIQNAVLAAYFSPVTPGLRDHVRQFTWDAAVQKTVEVYERVVRESGRRAVSSALAAPGSSPAFGVQAPAQVQSSGQSPAAASWRPSPPSTIPAPTKAEPGTSIGKLLEDGEEAARRGEFAEAKRLLGEAERMNPASARCLRSLGAVSLAEQNRTQARQYFERALAIDPREVKAIVGLGMCASFDGNQQQGFDYFVQALNIDPKQTTALHQLLQAAYALARYDTLEQALRRYLSEVPGDAEFQYCLAGCLYKQGKTQEASIWIEKVLAAQPSHRGATELRAQLASSAASAGAMRPASLKIELPTGFSRPVVSPIPSAAPAFSGTPASAAATTVATSAQPIPAEPSWMQAMKSAGVAMAVRAPGQSPAPASASSAAAPSPIGMGSSSFSMAAPQNAALGLTDVPVKLTRVEELKRTMKFDEAAVLCDQVLGVSALSGEDRERAELLRAEIHSMREEMPQATQLFDRVLQRNPRSARAFCGKGALAAHANRWSDAERLFSQALAVQPNHDVACAGLGLCAAQSGKHEDAWGWYWKATQSNPECLRALLGLVELAYPLKRLGQLEQALRAYLDMHPADLQFLYSLAGCLYAQNRVPEAKSEVEKIIIFQPQHARAIELQGMIEKKLKEAPSNDWRH